MGRNMEEKDHLGFVGLLGGITCMSKMLQKRFYISNPLLYYDNRQTCSQTRVVRA